MTTPGDLQFPPGFRTLEIQNADTTIHLRLGVSGPAVIMLHDALLAVMWSLVVAATTRQALRELRAEQALAGRAGRHTSRPYALLGR